MRKPRPATLTLCGAGALLAAVVTLTACTAASQVATAGGSTPTAPASTPSALPETWTACTPEGHRLYKFQSNKEGGLAVVPNDPTCPQPAEAGQ